jgi:hypothetical protein
MFSWARNACALVVSFALPVAASAQTPPPDAITGNAAPTTASTAITNFEEIKVSDPTKPLTLKYRGVYPSSETASLDGQGLVRTTDYTINYVTGVITWVRQVNPGQLFRITYQFDRNVQPVLTAGGTLRFNTITAPRPFGSEVTGVQHLTFTGDKTLAFSSTASFGELSSQGLLMFNTRQSGSTMFGLGLESGGPSSPDPSDSKFVLQSLSTGLMHGTVKFDYQDISSNFGNFAGVRAAGYDENTVNQLQKEAGLKRLGFSMQDVAVGGMKLTNSFKTVSDDNGSVSWKSFALQDGGFKFNFDARHVDLGFSRFSDMAESDRDQLEKEAGLARQDVGFSYASKTGGLSFASNQIKDENGQKIFKNDVQMNVKDWKLDFGNQSVASAFARFDSLTDQEKAQWATQSGVQRQWLNMQTGPVTKGGQPLKIAVEDISAKAGGEFKAADASVGGKNWALSYTERKTDQQLGLQANLPDAEVDKHVQAIATMYAPTGIATGPADRTSLVQGAALDRSGFRLTAQPLKGFNFDIEEVSLKGSQDEAYIQSLAMNGKNFDVTVKREHEGVNFFEAPQLFGFEQQRFGLLQGLDKTDFAMNWRMGGSKKLTMAMMDSDTTAGGAKRNSIEYTDKKIDVSLTTRSIDPGFGAVGTIPDGENGLLAALMGYKVTDFKANWTISSKMSFQALWENQDNDAQNIDTFDHNVLFNWDPNKTTHLSYTFFDTKSNNPLDLLYRSSLSSFLVSKDFGKMGKFQYMHQTQNQQDPTMAAAPTTTVAQAPGIDTTVPMGASVDDYLSYETKLDKNTSVKTEQSRTRYSDGSGSSTSANTISRSLTAHLGVSYTDLIIDRPGLDHDEKKNNYGVWFDLAKGMRFSYGIVRDLNPAVAGGNTANSTIGLTSGNVGTLHVDSAGYNVNSWDQTHNQVATNVAVKSSKPFKFGFFKEMQFNVGLDTSSDYGAFTKDNKLFNIGGKVGSNTFMVEYKSQLDATNHLGVDRFFKFETDQNDKKWIKASIKVKERETPLQGIQMIRDYSITVRPIKNFEITNQLLTNPEEQFRPDVLMGSVTSPWRANKYTLSYLSGKSTTIGATYEEKFDDLTRDYYRTSGINIDLFKGSASPLTFWYGLEQGGGTSGHQTAQRYYLKFYQRPGPNQAFNIFAGNISYDYLTGGFNRNNWTLNVDYELKFW